MRFCLCIFKSEAVKSDCSVFKDLIQTVGLPITSFTVSRHIKKRRKALKI